MQRGITKSNRLEANSSPIAEPSVRAVSLKRNKTIWYKVIGFAKKYYTLWEISEPYKYYYYQDSYEMRVDCIYIKNLDNILVMYIILIYFKKIHYFLFSIKMRIYNSMFYSTINYKINNKVK